MGDVSKKITNLFDGVRLDDSDVHALLAAVGDVIRQARESNGLLLIELAESWGGSMSVLCRIELARREAKMRQIIELSSLVGLRPSTALRAAEDMAFPPEFSPWPNEHWGTSL